FESYYYNFTLSPGASKTVKITFDTSNVGGSTRPPLDVLPDYADHLKVKTDGLASPSDVIVKGDLEPGLDPSGIKYANFSSYPLYALPLNGPGLNDVIQGNLSDCYVVSTVGAIAKS